MVLKFLLTNYLTLNTFKSIITFAFSSVIIQLKLIFDKLVILHKFSR
ncbi:hypothetical protein SAMN04489723_113105 [Algoriphagus aquimarinus]|uniref:Uncharacterized protein n=1 Tax=Algoriphagus aquimarinus TaxID=237018 RepID=A0A1I1BGB0_9BACT|nr:hypothetical protein SAMN04489723_113105 [Algoriphagus aquimarinus]